MTRPPGPARRPPARRALACASPPSGESGVRPGIWRAVHLRVSRPRGSRFGDVTRARMAPGGPARIERRRIPPHWARMTRGGVDRIGLGSHYVSRARPAPVPVAPGPRPRRPGGALPLHGRFRSPRGRGPRPPASWRPPSACTQGSSCSVRVCPGVGAVPILVPSRLIPTRSASTSLNPRARTPSRRSRGLSDVLAARAVPRRGGQVSWCGVLSVRWWWRAVPAAPPLLRPAVPRLHHCPLNNLPVKKVQCRSSEMPRTPAE